jgi:predicted phage terminase large subunit-like protein
MSWGELFSKDVTESLSWFGTSEAAPPDKLDGSYEDWLYRHHRAKLTAPLGNRHHALWKWFDALKKGVKPDPRIEGWPRGGAKSYTTQLGIAYVAEKGERIYCLYVSGTQEQADAHVADIGKIFDRCGMERSLNKYGHSKGWRRNQLRCANGFTVDAIGLDVAARGKKIDGNRPDLIIFDDIDDQEDTPKTTAKKERAIKNKIIPTGSIDCAVLFVQNLIMEDGVFAKLIDGRADFLLRRNVAGLEPAAHHLTYERVEDPDKPGRMVIKVTGGEPTWEGQNLETIQAQINEIGIDAFLLESQHEVQGIDGVFFDVMALRKTDPETWPRMVSMARGWDFAATAGGGDFTAGPLCGVDEHDVTYFHDVVRGQWGTEEVWKRVFQTARDDREKYGAVVTVIPVDPGAAGKAWAIKLATELKKEGFVVLLVPVQGKKSIRAKPLQKELNGGNVCVPKDAPWLFEWESELRKFREDEEHAYDDQVDGSADAFKGAKRPKAHVA